jgi:hypothetical protein
MNTMNTRWDEMEESEPSFDHIPFIVRTSLYVVSTHLQHISPLPSTDYRPPQHNTTPHNHGTVHSAFILRPDQDIAHDDLLPPPTEI